MRTLMEPFGIITNLGNKFLLQAPFTETGLPGSYDPWLVVLSFLVAWLASYTAFDLVGTIKQGGLHKGAVSVFWRIAAAVALGGGIWVMHFIGMLAFQFDNGMAIRYAPGLTAFSMLMAFVFSLGAVYMVTQEKMRNKNLVWGGIIIGTGLAVMLYTGMEAMQMSAVVRYNATLFALSIVVAAVTAMAALWLKFHLSTASALRRMIAGFVLSASICSMHYMGTLSAVFIPLKTPKDIVGYDSQLLAAEMALVMALVIGIGLAVSTLSRSMNSALQRQNDDLRREVDQRRRAEAELRRMNQRFSDTYNQLVQTEKMASIGQLAAGVAHEINNPMGYVNANIGVLKNYMENLFTLIDAYEEKLAGEGINPNIRDEMQALREKLELAYLRTDMPSLLNECENGLGRVKAIIDDLKTYSRRADDSHWQQADLNAGLDMTLNIIGSHRQYNVAIEKDYGKLPKIECIPQQIDQVFMNLIVNAMQAANKRPDARVKVRTRQEGGFISVEVIDNGIGISQENMSKLFEPFFTTKKVGEGTGLGLAISYNIVQHHGGTIEVSSTEGEGTRFKVRLPVKHISMRPVKARQDTVQEAS